MKLIGEAESILGYEATCDDGWFVITSERNGQYLGGGVEEKQFKRIIHLRRGASGSLVARVQMTAKFISHYLFKSEAESVGWFRFEAADDTGG